MQTSSQMSPLQRGRPRGPDPLPPRDPPASLLARATLLKHLFVSHNISLSSLCQNEGGQVGEGTTPPPLPLHPQSLDPHGPQGESLFNRGTTKTNTTFSFQIYFWRQTEYGHDTWAIISHVSFRASDMKPFPPHRPCRRAGPISLSPRGKFGS